MENEEGQKREDKEKREIIFVSVRPKEATHEAENLEKPAEDVWKLPRRWHVY